MILQTQGVTKTFGSGASEVCALRGVDLSIPRGEFLAIMGPSGSGKSTLLHLLGGIEPPTTGRIILEEQDLQLLNDVQRSILRRRRIGFVFQKINLLPTLSAVDNVALPLRLDGVSRDAALKRAFEALETTGIAHRANHRPSDMSGGEAQRVAVARALVIRPAVILGDEPTGALDSANSRHIVELFRQLATSHTQTVVVVTHDRSIAEAADRMILMRDGRIVEEESHLFPAELEAAS